VRIEQLEYVAAIARLGSFRRAAEELHISQPALSATVRNLEQELRVSILERGRSGAQVSDEGRDLLPRIIEAIEAIDRLRAAADDQHRSSRVIRVATVNAGTVPVLTPTAGAFRALHPDTRVELIGAQEAEIHSGLSVRMQTTGRPRTRVTVSSSGWGSSPASAVTRPRSNLPSSSPLWISASCAPISSTRVSGCNARNAPAVSSVWPP
jgi:molybdenum-dependent DNA-binding transcriptional regulator ModE